MSIKLSIGNDHGGYSLAMHLIKELKNSNASIIYHGAFAKNNPVDYIDYAACVGNDIISSRSEIGVLICKTGTGMCMAANKINGIRAANCWNTQVAQLARAHNNANILCLGADYLNMKDAYDIVETFLASQFNPQYLKRLEKIVLLENFGKDSNFNLRFKSLMHENRQN
jgi:RpiB/LacA/LacB family sugar-phosphate isomerase